MILLSWLRFVGEDRGGALLPLESVDLIAQALIFFLSQPQGSHRVFQHVEQLLDEFASAGICDAVQVQVVKHVAIDSREKRYTRRAYYACWPCAWQPKRGCTLSHGFLKRYLRAGLCREGDSYHGCSSR